MSAAACHGTSGKRQELQTGGGHDWDQQEYADQSTKKSIKIPPLLKNAAVGDFFIGKLHFGCLFLALFLTF
jgi:hypothetical protein